MPESVTHRVSTYYKLGKEEVGFTSVNSRRLSTSEAMDWLVGEIPEEAVEISYADSGTPGQDIVTLVINWSKVADSIRDPKIPTRNGQRL
jgi:hypothetical protein